jgi:hypothetical protein
MKDILPRFTHTRIIALLLLLLVISIGMGVYFYQKATVDPQKSAQQELNDIVAAVGRLMILPADETPTLATVSDPEKLKDQPFFANAKRGDKVLVYPISRKAILYSPSLNKIIEVAPVNPGGGDTTNVPIKGQ